MTAIKSATLPSPRWTDLPERGTPLILRVFHWIAITCGRATARVLLYPINLYFVIGARTARRVSYQYLRRILGRRVHWRDVFRHFHCFASTILDRVYLLRGEFSRFNVTVHGADILHRNMETGQGCILLGSHLGSFEVLRTLGLTKRFQLKVLMNVEHNENLTRFLDSLNPDVADTVIVPDRPDTLLRIRENLDRGFLIGTLGDRVTENDKTTSCHFLGAPATFPAGPMIISALMHRPIVLFFGLYRGGNRYEIHFEHFADEILLNRERRTEQLQQWTQCYADRLEHYTRMAPYNWFNFYPFWS
ncbi:MAG: lipid A biosynthesis acyltransferase [Chthoniobacterales bacterium]